MMDRMMVFEQARQVMGRMFNVPPDTITEATRAVDVKGWDSLSHLILLTGLEKKFDVELPAGRAHAAQDVGELVALIQEVQHEQA